MRFLWVDEGNDPDFNKGGIYGMTGYYFPLRDPIPDVKRRLEMTLSKSLRIGVYACWNWHGLGFSLSDGAGFARWVDDRLRELVGAGFVLSPSKPKVQLNNERHEPDVILSMLETWRNLRPRQDTSWTLEGMQGGWMDAPFVERLLKCKVRLAPQLYNGIMSQQWDSLAVTRNLTRRGIPDALVSPFYDAAKLPEPYYWDGFAFTQGRLK